MNSSQTMQCIRFASTGEPQAVLQYETAQIPQPGPGEVRVRMLASPINPSDMMFIRGIYGTQPSLPQIPGFEGVGIVEASGGGLRGQLFTGKRVVVLNKAGGNWAEQTIVPAAQVIPVSSALSVEQAATFFVNPATAWIMTREVLRVPKGKWLLQTAAGSSLGKMVVRLGQQTGFRTINVVRSESAVDALKAEGATEVIVFDPESDSPETLQELVQQLVGADGLKYAIDPVGGKTASAVLQSLTAGGRLLLFGTLCDQPLKLSPRTLMQNQASVEGFWLGNYMSSKSLPFKLRLIKRITRLIREGVLTTSIAGHYPLGEINEAIQSAERKARRGKTILRIADA